ncbi:MAG: hypothetical protein HOB82_00750 [Alphaproteobacteria bacterium]|nr:hypothetical protein [Alphaproteobacteria bacterium]MBT4710046.1 hypothetical protein [Alphaproteobacteria bacterium]MBT5860917.1 hypothetical protein [Alphaproteobacteria bacterium]
MTRWRRLQICAAEGTGLGLPLVKSFVELHGGQFILASEPDVGTSATLRFPVDRVVQIGAAEAP